MNIQKYLELISIYVYKYIYIYTYIHIYKCLSRTFYHMMILQII